MTLHPAKWICFRPFAAQKLDVSGPAPGYHTAPSHLRFPPLLSTSPPPMSQRIHLNPNVPRAPMGGYAPDPVRPHGAAQSGASLDGGDDVLSVVKRWSAKVEDAIDGYSQVSGTRAGSAVGIGSEEWSGRTGGRLIEVGGQLRSRDVGVCGRE
jgi:hypothetical protein